MIFNRFFTPAHRSDNPQTRLKAIDNLSPGKPQDKTILHELAFNDASCEVTLAALHRLNSFALWQKMSAIGQTDRVKREAQKQVEGILKGQIDVSISDADRRAFLLESASTALISDMLRSDEGLHDDAAFVQRLLARVNNTSLTLQLFHDTPNPALQRAIVDSCDDHDMLTRLERKVSDETLSAQIAAKIDALHQAKQKPLQLKKAVTLCLSKYQALLDKDDYPDVTSKADALEHEYQSLMNEQACLTVDDQNLFASKHQRINAQIERHAARLAPQWQARQTAREIASTLNAADEQMGLLNSSLKSLFNEQLLSATAQHLSDLADHLATLDEHIQQLAVLDEGHARLPELAQQYAQLVARFDSFGAQQRAGQEALAVLTEAEAFFAEIDVQQGVSESARNTASTIAAQWQQAITALTVVPDTWNERWNRIWSGWKQTLEAQDGALEKQLKHARKQLNIIDNQIEQGRFRLAMRSFTQLKSDYQALSDKQQHILARRFEQTQAEVERLEGWQSYLAAPRKPALLEEARQLADQQADDIAQRAETIRYLRQQWKSLGDTGDTQDAPQNAQFDAYLEQAFAPCREYYARQDEAREQAFSARQQLISQIETLKEIESPAALAKALEKLKEQWHSAGQVDAKRYRKLKTQWDSAIAVHQQRVTDWQQQNRQTKQKLIDEARRLADEADDLDAAASEAQQLQLRWKQAGHAGRRAESSLWRSFKEANDALFARIKEKRRSERDAQSQVAESLFSQLASVAQQVGQQSADTIRQTLSEIEADSQALAGPAKRKLHKKISDVHSQLKAQASLKQQAAQQAKYDALLVLLENWHRDEPMSCVGEDTYQALGRHWQQACGSQEASAFTRPWLTTALEIHAAMPSPDDAAEERQAVQLELLSAKMAQGEKWSVDALIAHWLSAGVIASADKPLAERVAHVIRQYKS